MIAKRSNRRNDGKSSFDSLAKYIMDEKRDGEKVELSHVTNCLSDDYGLAVKEIEATQAINKRTRNDKTYHLIVSFRSGDNPTKEQLLDIEKNVCQAIGYKDHQRLSAVHNDTDNTHVHIAINKIHPKTFNCIEPYYDHYKLDDICKKMEVKHNLQKDNRIGDSRKITGKAADMESHSGRESFQSWVSGNPRTDLKKVLSSTPDWGTAHKALAKYNLEIRKRGAGFVIADRNRKLFVKASDIDRQFSKNSLEKKLGDFVAPSENVKKIPPAAQYQEPVLQPESLSNDLYEEYQDQRNELIVLKREAFEKLKSEKESRYQELKTVFAERRKEIKTDVTLKNKVKRDLYKKLAAHRKDSYTKAKNEFSQKRALVHQKYKLQNWQDFLLEKAVNGDERALEALRKSKKRPQRGTGNKTFEGVQGSESHHIYKNLNHKVRKNGDVVYELGNGARLRDEGQLLRLESGQDAALLKALQIAQLKYGECLKIGGSEAFKSKVVKLVVQQGLNIKFSDQGMEKSKEALKGNTRNRSKASAVKRSDQLLQEYIEKRNSLRAKASDISYHRKYSPDDSGVLKYGGQRSIGEGYKVGLFYKNNETLVVPLTDYQAEKIKRLKVGSEVSINKKGQVSIGIER